MKEITHKQLTQLTISQTIPLTKEQLDMILYYSIEPDILNRERLENKKGFAIPLSWFLEHTVRAKDLSIYFIKIAKEKYKSNENWLQPLGWAYHFIVDWATPCHSLHSKLNSISSLTDVGKQIGEKSFKAKTFKERLSLTVLNVGVLGVMGVGIAKKRHDNFEKMCDYRWTFINQRKMKHKFRNCLGFSSEDTFESLMNELRDYINNIERNWILKCSQNDYIDYMIKIVRVMVFATLLVIK